MGKFFALFVVQFLIVSTCGQSSISSSIAQQVMTGLRKDLPSFDKSIQQENDSFCSKLEETVNNQIFKFEIELTEMQKQNQSDDLANAELTKRKYATASKLATMFKYTTDSFRHKLNVEQYKKEALEKERGK